MIVTYWKLEQNPRRCAGRDLAEIGRRRAVLAAETDSLQDPREQQQRRRQHADLFITRGQHDQQRSAAHEQHGKDQRGLASFAVREPSEQQAADRSHEEANREHRGGVHELHCPTSRRERIPARSTTKTRRRRTSRSTRRGCPPSRSGWTSEAPRRRGRDALAAMIDETAHTDLSIAANATRRGPFSCPCCDQNAGIPVIARPRISAWMSCVPS